MYPQQHLLSTTSSTKAYITLLLLFSCCSGVLSLASNNPGTPQSLTNLICAGRPRQSCDVQIDVPQDCVASSASSCPIVFFLHGAGGTNARYASTSGVHQKGYIGVYPRGEQGWNTGPKPTNNCDWSDFGCTQDPDEGDFIAAIIAELRNQGATGNVYAIGSSNGAALAHRLASNAGDELPIKGIVAKVTQLLASPERSGPGVLNYNQPRSGSPAVSVLSIMGTADPIIPYNGGSSNVFGGDNAFQLMSSLDSMTSWAVHNGCDATFVLDESYVTDQGSGTASKYDYTGGCAGGVILEHYAIHGGGHNAGGVSINNERVDYDIAYDFIDRLESGSAGSPVAPSTPSAPIPSPTQSPVGTCVDDPSWHGRFNAAHTCDFVAQAPRQRCGWRNVDGVLASTACVEACGGCSAPNPSPTSPNIFSPTESPVGTCADDPSWQGRFNAAHTCAYVARAPKRRCRWKNAAGVLASTACGEACGVCSLRKSAPRSRSTTTSVPIGATQSLHSSPMSGESAKSVQNESVPTLSDATTISPEEQDSSARTLAWSLLCKALFLVSLIV